MIRDNTLNSTIPTFSLHGAEMNHGHSIIGSRGRVAFYYIYTAFTLGAAATVLIPQSDEGAGSNLVFSIAWITMHAISLILLLGFKTHQKYQVPVLAAISAYIIGSSVWSASPLDTLVYGGMVAGNIATAYMIARDLSPRAIMLMSARLILTLAILGMLLSIAGYSQMLYFDAHERLTILGTQPIRGFFNHKITSSLYATLGAVACLACFRNWKRIFAVGCLGLFVCLTGSSTGLVIFPTSIALFLFFSFLRRVQGERVARAIAITGVIISALVIGALTAHIDALLTLLGRDPTLTGRTLLWDWGIQTWLQSPLLGWGFSGYFNGPDAIAISDAIKSFENYNVPHFHQSYIQTAVDLGAPGLIILTLVQYSIISRAWKLMRETNSAVGAGILTLMGSITLASTSMFVFINYNHYVTLIMFVVYFSLRQRPPRMRPAHGIPYAKRYN